MSIIPAKDVGRVILEEMRDFVRKEYPNATDAEREKMLAKFLNALGAGLFAAPMK